VFKGAHRLYREEVAAMNISKPKEHRAWRPRMSSDSEFNPFMHSTGTSEASFDRRSLEEIEDQRHESEREDEAEPTKSRDD
jgi:hypothetical protein